MPETRPDRRYPHILTGLPKKALAEYTRTGRCREPILAGDDALVAQEQAHTRDHGGAESAHVPLP
jgi:hypothetical protein